MVDVVKGGVVFDQNRQTDALGVDEIGAPVSERVSLELRGDVHREALALAGFAVPRLAFWIDACSLPHRELAHMCTGLIAARNKRRVGFGDAPQGVGGLEPFDLRGIRFRADDHEVVVHDEPARSAVPVGHPGLLGVRRMRKQHVAFAPSALL